SRRNDIDEVADGRNRVRQGVHFDFVDVQASVGDFDADAGGGNGTAALRNVKPMPEVTGEVGIFNAGQVLDGADGGPTSSVVAGVRRVCVGRADRCVLQGVGAEGAIRAGAATAAVAGGGVTIIAAPGDAGEVDRGREGVVAEPDPAERVWIGIAAHTIGGNPTV